MTQKLSPDARRCGNTSPKVMDSLSTGTIPSPRPLPIWACTPSLSRRSASPDQSDISPKAGVPLPILGSRLPTILSSKHSFQIGEWWLSQRDGSPAWYATFYDATAKRTRRVSLGTDDFEQASQKLLERYLEEHRPQNAPAASVALADIVLDYYKHHGQQARSATSIRKSCSYWVDFFGVANIADATKPARLEAFIAHLTAQGHATAYIQRILGVGKAALKRAWRRGEIAGAPYITSVKVNYGEPLGRPLKLAELARLLSEAPDHLRMLLMIMIGTACRPEAALEPLHVYESASEIGLTRTYLQK
jgi:hypothetical protein